MVTLRRGDRAGPVIGAVGAVDRVDDDLFAPGARFPLEVFRGVEVITYVHEGVLVHEDATGRSWTLRAGELERRKASGVGHEANGSTTSWAHVLRIQLRASPGRLAAGHEQRRFSAAQRRGGLCVVASPDGRRGSLLIHADVIVHSALLHREHHLVHALGPARSAWLHVVHGAVQVGDVVLGAGDRVVISGEPTIALTARVATELLLLDLGGVP